MCRAPMVRKVPDEMPRIYPSRERTPREALSRLRRSTDAMQRHANAIHRGYSGHRIGGCRAYDSPRLVRQLSQTSRAEGFRRTAWCGIGKSCACPFGVAPLRTRQYHFADRGSLQLPFADEDQLGWSRADVLPAAGSLVSLVRTK